MHQLLLLTTICLLASTSYANNQATIDSTNIPLPFGIRHYDTGAAQDFTLQDIDGESFQLNQTRGQWVFLHFWASWCGPCREEMPAVQRLTDTIKDDRFKIVMINTAEDEDTIFEFLASIGVELNSLMDPDGQVTEHWKPRGLPTTFLINPQGNIKYQAIGGREWNKEEYIQFIKKLLSSITY